MNNFLNWIHNNRRPIGYTIGGLNLLAALSHALNGNYGLAILWLVIGGFLVLDARVFGK